MDDIDVPGGIDSSDADYQINELRAHEADLRYGAYTKLREYLAHYNIVKLKYKSMSRTWMIASFVGYGYLLSGQETGLPVSDVATMLIVSIMAAIGILLIGFLDILVYHRMIDAIYNEELDLETKDHQLTNTHHNMVLLLLRGSTGPVIYDGAYYAVMVTVLLAVGIASLYSLINPFNHTEAIIVTTLAMTLLAILNVFIILTARHSSVKYLFSRRKKTAA